ncbi:MAG: hypothetical protein JWQ71_1061 [Pedosphaera sp.]|nr:hypothetical protein [Pedosphaera sp.]
MRCSRGLKILVSPVRFRLQSPVLRLRPCTIYESVMKKPTFPLLFRPIAAIILARPLWVYRQKVKAHLHAIEGALQACKENKERFKKNGLTEYEQLYNIAIYIFLSNHDLTVLQLKLTTEGNPRIQSMYERQIVVLLYESLDDIPVMLGKDFRKNLLKLKEGASLIVELDKITKAISKFKQSHERDLKEIRNVIGAHFDKDVDKYLRVLEKLDHMKVSYLIKDYQSCIANLIGFFTQLITIMGDPVTIFLRLAKSPKYSGGTSSEKT